jgi:hypothetical protein
LYPPNTAPHQAPADPNTPVVAETYDEVVFTDPTEPFYHQLLAVRDAPKKPDLYSHAKHFGTFSDEPDMLVLLEAQKFLQSELPSAKERWTNVSKELDEVEDALLRAPPPAAAPAVNRTAAAPTASAPAQPAKRKSKAVPAVPAKKAKAK